MCDLRLANSDSLPPICVLPEPNLGESQLVNLKSYIEPLLKTHHTMTATCCLVLAYGLIHCAKRRLHRRRNTPPQAALAPFFHTSNPILMHRSLKLILLLALCIATHAIARGQWTQLGNFPLQQVSAVHCHAGKLYAATSQHLYTSADAGASWESSAPFLRTDDEVSDIFVQDSAIYLAMVLGGVNVSTDGGATWRTNNTGLEGLGSKSLSMFAQRGDKLYAATYGAGVFGKSLASPDAPWSSHNFGMPWGNVVSIFNDGGTLLAGAGANATFAREVAGSGTWSEIPFGAFNGTINSFLGATRDGDVLLGVGTQGLYRSTDGGLTWTHTNAGTGLAELARLVHWQGQTLALLTKPSGSFLRVTPDRGLSWASFSEALPNNALTFDITSNGKSLFCGRDNGVWVLSPSVPTQNPGDAGGFTLGQNFPNPASGTQATIPFELGNESDAHLCVYDAQGRMVFAIMFTKHPAGQYSFPLNIEGWPAGIYRYTMMAGDWAETRTLCIQP